MNQQEYGRGRHGGGDKQEQIFAEVRRTIRPRAKIFDLFAVWKH
jgi:hypothetical protein